MILVEQGDKKVYSDTRELEEEMLRIAEAFPEDLSQDYIAKDSRYTVNNTFSSVRRNLLNWYNFKPHSNVLEVGAGMGALTGCLCDKCETVTALEMSTDRAKVIRARYPDRKNLSIVCEDIMSWQTDEKFDYIVVVGVLEYAGIFCESKDDPFEYFIKNLKRFLKEGGIVLLAIENRFGLKYWCGASEDHLCKPFLGIQGYEEENTPVTFSKADLDALFARTGFSYRKFFYVLPDYKFPTVIFSDYYFPSESAIQKLALSYVKNSMLLYNEYKLYSDILKNDVQDFFANSFLIEASDKESEIIQPVYVAGRGECKKEYRVSTLIYPDGRVEKIPMHTLAKKHIDTLFENEKRLTQRGINVLESKKTDRGLQTTFFKGVSGEERFHQLLQKNDFGGLIKLIRLLEQKILQSSELSEKNELAEEGILDKNKDYGLILADGYVDMILSNCFLKENDLIFFDQEWRFDNIPVGFVLYYAIRQSYLSFTGKTKISLESIFLEIQLTEKVNDYTRLEEYIWNKILYRQQHYYDEDGWYNHYNNDILFSNELERLKKIEINSEQLVATINKKNEYIEGITKEVKEKNKYIDEMINQIEEKNKYIEDLESYSHNLENRLTQLDSQIIELNKHQSILYRIKKRIGRK